MKTKIISEAKHDPPASGAYFRDYSTSWSISVDFREDPGAGTTASISFTKNGNGVMPSSTGYDAFRMDDMPRAEASLFNFFNLQGLSPERVSALATEATKQWKATGDPRYLETLFAAQREIDRRAEEERKKREKENKCKGKTGNGGTGPAACPVT